MMSRRRLLTLRFIGLAWVAMMPAAAAAGAQPEETARLVIISLVVLVALLIGLLLYAFSQRSSHAQFKSGGIDTSAKRGDAIHSPKMLLPVILEQLNQLPASAQQRQQVARTVSDIVTQTLDEQVGIAKRESDERYSQVIEEKRHSEAVLQKKYQETLVEKKQTSAVLESIAEGLVVINNKGDVVMMNPAAERLLAVHQAERIGKPLLDNLQDSQLVSLVRGGPDEEREIVLNAKQDSTKRILRASNAVISDENGRTVGMVAVLSDVTKQRELEQLKSEFLSTVSHELRTPIVAMQHSIAILADQVAGTLSEEQLKFVGVAQRNLERLNTLITDLLDLSKMEAKKMELRLETRPIGPAIKAVCDSLEAWAGSKSITFVKRLPDDLPDATFDQARITQVLTNLIGNAIKFTPKQGRITVEAKRTETGEAEVSVSDTGVGIAKEDLPKLFSKFQQVGERAASDISGTGLGLAIAKEIVELHHGRIWAESERKQGARFAFTLPLSPPSSAG